MLRLKDIKKDYGTGEGKVAALKGVTIEFRKNELAAVLGPSGCGKTTMLNIIGGLDKYTSGDLVIDGKSTKRFVDRDWDTYRNNTIGFVFQGYNLIPHQTVFENVAVSLTLAGIGAAERKCKVEKALSDVGLKDQIYKKPNQLSGGQMQRVAIARALVNDPEIILADEPTGALDSKTSEQILDILKGISKDRLVIMVTHNSELADRYADRIVRLKDGEVVSDSNPYSAPDAPSGDKQYARRSAMSFATALKLSFKNLLTKKTRTIITSIAGSIGIIGIALVLAISSGMTTYINKMQGDTLAGFPLSVLPTTTQTAMRMNGSDALNFIKFPDADIIYSYDKNDANNVHVNKINSGYLNYVNELDPDLYNAVYYSRALSVNILAKADDATYKTVGTSTGISIIGATTGNCYEIPDNPAFVQNQYDKLTGKYPENASEAMLVVDQYNRLGIDVLSSLGIKYSGKDDALDFNAVLGKVYKVAFNDDIYIPNGSGGFTVKNLDNNAACEEIYNASAQSLTVVGIFRVKESASSELLRPGLGYTAALTEIMLTDAKNSAVVAAQKSDTAHNAVTGAPFSPTFTYERTMQAFGGDDTPIGIQIYPKSFDAKESIKKYLDAFNDGKAEDDKIIYNDLAEMVSSAISTLISTITIILTAFGAIALVVSSIMIGIITYVSVVERTKEIGILRSIGARKKDVSRVFNAETLIIGFAAGLLGVLVTYLLSIPVNLIVYRLVEVKGIAALPLLSAALLIAISMVLTLIAGLLPARIAAKKDPVVALRSE